MSDSTHNVVTNEPVAFTTTSREITIPISSRFSLNKPGSGVKHNTEFMQCFVGIGADHYAVLTMTVEAWEALQGGAEVHTMIGSGESEYKDFA